MAKLTRSERTGLLLLATVLLLVMLVALIRVVSHEGAPAEESVTTIMTMPEVTVPDSVKAPAKATKGKRQSPRKATPPPQRPVKPLDDINSAPAR